MSEAIRKIYIDVLKYEFSIKTTKLRECGVYRTVTYCDIDFDAYRGKGQRRKKSFTHNIFRIAAR